jgi:hypothetical protein
MNSTASTSKAQDEQVIEEPDDELAQELEKPKKELLH